MKDDITTRARYKSTANFIMQAFVTKREKGAGSSTQKTYAKTIWIT